MGFKSAYVPRTTRVLAILMFMCVGANAQGCPDASDMTKGVQVTHRETRERTVFQRTAKGLILETRMARARHAEQPKQRLLHAGILGVQERYDDGRKLDLVYDQGPVFPKLPMPQGRYSFLGHATGDRQEVGLYDEFLINVPETTIKIGRCRYRIQIVSFSSARTKGSGEGKEIGTGIGRIFLSEELGFPLRREWYADASSREVIASETVGRIEKMVDVGGL